MAIPATVAVLTYHSIGRSSTRSFAPLTVDPALFDEQLSALREAGLDMIQFRDAPASLASGRSAVAITIDDGLADAAEHAAPVLARHGLTATLFVPTAYVGRRSGWLPGADAARPMLSWAGIAALSRAGYEIGSHGRMHLAADINSCSLVRSDALASRIELEDQLGQAVPSFAYPFGYQSRAARVAVREAGFAQACAVGDLPACAHDDRWALPRLQVWAGTSPEALLKLTAWRPSIGLRGWAHAKQHAWRAGRRWAGLGPQEARRLEGVTR